MTARLWHISSSNKQQRCSQSGRREWFVKKKKEKRWEKKLFFFYHRVSLVRTKWGRIDRQGWTGNMCSKQRSFCKLQQPCSVRHRSFQELQGSISWVSPCRPSVWHETHISSAQQQRHTNERRAEDGIVNTQHFTSSTKNTRHGKYDLAMQRLPVPHSVLSYKIAHYNLSLEQNKNKHILLFFFLLLLLFPCCCSGCKFKLHITQKKKKTNRHRMVS